MFRIDIVECLDDWPAQLLRDPAALNSPTFNPINPAITLLRIVVAGIDDHYTIRRTFEQILWQRGNVLLGNCNDYDVTAACRLLDSDGSRTRLSGQTTQCFRSSRVGDKDFVTEFAKAAGQRSANVSRADDAYVHFASFSPGETALDSGQR